MRRLLSYLWASPASLLGLVLAAPCIAAGGTARLVCGALEVSAQPIADAFRRESRFANVALAITFGHVILASHPDLLDEFRAHEHVHVSQYERWGPLFFLLYLGSSLIQVLRGSDPYRGNHFERVAFTQPGHAQGETTVA